MILYKKRIERRTREKCLSKSERLIVVFCQPYVKGPAFASHSVWGYLKEMKKKNFFFLIKCSLAFFLNWTHYKQIYPMHQIGSVRLGLDGMWAVVKSFKRRTFYRKPTWMHSTLVTMHLWRDGDSRANTTKQEYILPILDIRLNEW